MKYIYIIVLLATVAMGCQRDEQAVNDFLARLEPNVERAEGVEVLYSDSARVQVRITADVMLTHLDNSNPRKEFPDGIYVEFFGGKEQVGGTLSAQYAEYLESKRVVVVRDSVVWKTEGGERLDTEELHWNENKGKIYTDKMVIVSRPDEVIYGRGFEANQDFSNAKIKVVTGRKIIKNPN